MAYFEKLNYSLSNEDTRVEYELLPLKTNEVFSIAGSGARVLPLIARNPKRVRVLDLVESQLFLTELRLAAAKTLSYEEYLFLLGFRGALVQGPDAGDDRVALFERLPLSPKAKEFWTTHQREWSPHGFILIGKWESHFQKLGFVFRKVLRFDLRPIFEAHSLEEQRELYKKHFNRIGFRNFLRVFASEFVFNKFLYKGHFAGGEGRRTEKKAPWEFLDEQFHRLFTTSLVRKNYFLQVLFLGRIYYEEGLPLDVQPFIVDQIKSSKTEVEYVCGNQMDHLPTRAFDFLSLSDTISYLTNEDQNQILQKLHPNTKPGSLAVIRSFLRAPRAIETKGWTVRGDLNEKYHRMDGTGVYQFHIFEKA